MVAVGSPIYASEHARMGCSLRRVAAQTLPDATTTTVSWDTEDADTNGLWSSGTTITIPTGGGGIWSISSRLVIGAAASLGLLLFLVNSAEVARYAFSVSSVEGAGAFSMPLSAADTVQVQMYADTAAGTTMTATVHLYRVGL